MSWNKDSTPSVFWTELRVLKRLVARLEKDHDRTEDRISKIRKTCLDQVRELKDQVALLRAQQLRHTEYIKYYPLPGPIDDDLPKE